MSDNSEPRRHRILIVDDQEDNIDILEARLTAWGFDTATASDGVQALASVEANPPDLILLDVMMPVMDGREVARRIKGNPDLPFIPIIMQTALDSTESKVEGLEAGADDYITKPIEFKELEARIRSMLRIKKLQEALAERERELSEANERLTFMSQTDALTGLHNRRYLEDSLSEMFAHSDRLGEPITCVMCDIDKFKSVNDTYGHQAGDQILKQFADILRKEAREIDKIGRYGGEEFMLLLPGTVLDAGVTFAERVRKAVEEHTFTFDGGAISKTVSCGVAGWPHPRINNTDRLVCAADDALYVAKETGRNRVVRFDSDDFKAHTKKDGAIPEDHVHPEHAEREVAGAGAGNSQAGSEGSRASA